MRMPRGAAVLALLLHGCNAGAPARVETPADSAAGELRFRLVGPNEAALVVPVYINGQGPIDFILDTGATFTCVERRTAERLGLEPQPLSLGVGVGVGGAGRLELVRIDSIRVGSARAFRLPACVLDLQGMRMLGTDVEGLLGLNFLKNFRLTVDFERSVVGLAAPTRR